MRRLLRRFIFSDFENHPDSTIFMMEFLTSDCKNDETFISVANVFETWINGRTNQNTEQLEKEEFTAGWIMKRLETLLSENSRRRSFDRIRQMKLYELGQERVRKMCIQGASCNICQKACRGGYMISKEPGQ